MMSKGHMNTTVTSNEVERAQCSGADAKDDDDDDDDDVVVDDEGDEAV
jgi:hypothetical protein